LSRNVRVPWGDDLGMASTGFPYTTKIATLCVAAALFGCSEGGDVSIATPAATAVATAPLAQEVAPTPVAGEPAAPVVPASLDAASEAAADDETSPTAEGIEEEKPTDAQYTPPFPDRVDLFVPPKRQGGVVLKEGGTEDAVELLGFIRVDKQQVVLSVNGQLTRIAEGDSQYGIEVISIEPPKVLLQRGRQRWQASLEK
jgi:hypothetical protein